MGGPKAGGRRRPASRKATPGRARKGVARRSAARSGRGRPGSTPRVRGGPAKPHKRRPVPPRRPAPQPQPPPAALPASPPPAPGLDSSAGPGLAWVPAPDGYELALDDGKLACRNPAGKRLASVPKPVRDSEAASALEDLRDWLAEHDRTCAETVTTWMLRSLPVPRTVLESVWPDPAWRRCLENVVVAPADGAARPDGAAAGFLRALHPDRGAGVVDLDGETRWHAAPRLALPHPVLLPDLDDFRALATELGLHQGIAQLYRETFPRPRDLAADRTALSDYSGGKFAQLMHAVGKCRALGYPVRGGFAVTTVWEGGRLVEARHWVGADAPDAETYTGDLLWVDERERALRLGDVGPVAWSEGVRMASAIWAARVVEGGREGTP